MLNKARKRLWTLRHTKKAGLKKEDLLKNFNSTIRPALEYAAPTYHSMLTKEMTDEIENIQKRASKLIFGWDSNYSELVNAGKIELLSERRRKLTVNFAKKTQANERFKDWFPVKKDTGHNLRTEKKFEEFHARTERLKKSPLFYMRRELNAI